MHGQQNVKKKMSCKGSGRKRSWLNLMYYPRICLEGLRDIMTIIGQVSVTTKVLNSYYSEYEKNIPQSEVNFILKVLYHIQSAAIVP